MYVQLLQHKYHTTYHFNNHHHYVCEYTRRNNSQKNECITDDKHFRIMEKVTGETFQKMKQGLGVVETE